MELIPEIHLEDWEMTQLNEDNIIYTKGKIRIIDDGTTKTLQLRSIDNKYFTLKTIDNYWELSSYNIFINSDIVTDEENMEYQTDFMLYIRDSSAKFDNLVFNKLSGHIYGVNNLFDSDGWSDEILENMWDRNEIEIINLDEATPTILKKDGWGEIDLQKLNGSIWENRDINLSEI